MMAAITNTNPAMGSKLGVGVVVEGTSKGRAASAIWLRCSDDTFSISDPCAEDDGASALSALCAFTAPSP
jgi:hypothetical protein